MIRTAISPRLAMRTLLSTTRPSLAAANMVTAMPHPGANREAGSGPAWTVRRFNSIDSTNSYLIDQARGGAEEGLVVVADHQTAGRGRLGRAWLAKPGSSLLVSVLLRPHLPPRLLPLCTVVVGLSALDACQEHAWTSH